MIVTAQCKSGWKEEEQAFQKIHISTCQQLFLPFAGLNKIVLRKGHFLEPQPFNILKYPKFACTQIPQILPSEE